MFESVNNNVLFINFLHYSHNKLTRAINEIIYYIYCTIIKHKRRICWRTRQSYIILVCCKWVAHKLIAILCYVGRHNNVLTAHVRNSLLISIASSVQHLSSNVNIFTIQTVKKNRNYLILQSLKTMNICIKKYAFRF